MFATTTGEMVNDQRPSVARTTKPIDNRCVYASSTVWKMMGCSVETNMSENVYYCWRGWTCWFLWSRTDIVNAGNRERIQLSWWAPCEDTFLLGQKKNYILLEHRSTTEIVPKTIICATPRWLRYFLASHAPQVTLLVSACFSDSTYDSLVCLPRKVNRFERKEPSRIVSANLWNHWWSWSAR